MITITIYDDWSQVTTNHWSKKVDTIKVRAALDIFKELGFIMVWNGNTVTIQ